MSGQDHGSVGAQEAPSREAVTEPAKPSWTAESVVRLLVDMRDLNAGDFWAKYPDYSPGDPLIGYACTAARLALKATTGTATGAEPQGGASS